MLKLIVTEQLGIWDYIMVAMEGFDIAFNDVGLHQNDVVDRWDFAQWQT